jgi:hypothetical protein
MRVAVLGSWRKVDKKSWKLRETPEAFQATCRRVGRELIERGHALIVGTDSDHTADGNASKVPSKLSRLPRRRSNHLGSC